MFAHATDSLPSYQIAYADAASTTMMAVASDAHPRPAIGASVPAAGDWKVAPLPGTDGLCFVRRGTGGWNGVITVCDGRLAPLGEVQRATLQPAVSRQATTLVMASPISWLDSVRRSLATPAASLAWQRGASYLLLAIGLGLAMKSGSMLLQGSRKYG